MQYSYTQRDKLNDHAFQSNLISVLRDIWLELRRANELTEQLNKSFSKEQERIDNDVGEAIGQVKNLNLNVSENTRKLDKVGRPFEGHEE